MYSRIGFWDGDFGYAVADVLFNSDGHSVFHGPTVASIRACVDFLAQWDYGDDDNVVPSFYAEIGTNDEVFRSEDYIIASHRHIGYVALYRILPSHDGEFGDCLVCGESIQYCQGGHTDADYIDADDEYSSLYSNLERMTEGL